MFVALVLCLLLWRVVAAYEGADVDVCGHCEADEGSIPACAGEPAATRPTPWAKRVYPRVCGGTRGHASYSLGKAGLSPRVRGNLSAPVGDIGHTRSIPACAGEPDYTLDFGLLPGVYPRVCGGTDR